MDCDELKLKRVCISNFKSVKRLELDHLGNLALFMGRNNAGKSNILDCFKFVADAAVSFERAFSVRGGKFSEIAFRKQASAKIEFTFDFVPQQEKRAQWIRTLFASNKQITPDAALATAFLTTMTLKIAISEGQFSEELLVPNLRAESRPVTVFSVMGTTQEVFATSGGLETLCARCATDLPSDSPATDLPPQTSAPFRLRLAHPDGANKFPVSTELAALVAQQFTELEWIDPLRRMPAAAAIEGKTVIAPDASNLPDVLHGLYNNKPRLFRQIESEIARLVPQLGRLYTPTTQNAAALGLIDSQDEDLVYSMDQMSFGTRSLAAIVAKVVLAKPGSWVCIEEPETYLHPQAQLGLFQFIRNQSAHKRIFLATHSTFIAASCPIDSLWIVRRDERGSTAASPVTEENALDAIEQLGVKPSFSFEADAIVFVEGADIIPVFDAWAAKFGFKIRVQFIDMEEGATLHFHANARVALGKYVQTLVFAVFNSGPQSARERVAGRMQLTAMQTAALNLSETEGFLLDAKAIAKVFSGLSMSEKELEEQLQQARAQTSSKKALRDFLAQERLGEYTGTLGARIATAMEAIPEPVRQLFERIDAESKPFLRI